MNVKREDRICKLCTTEELEDECHFIFRCPALSEPRNELMEGVSFPDELIGEIEKLSFLTECENIEQLGQIVERLYKVRRSMIYK